MIPLPKKFLISSLEILNSVPVTTFKIHRDGALNLDLTPRVTVCVSAT
jgi:hypothetical protein